MRSERGDFRFGPIAGVALIVLATIGLFAVCSGDDDDELGRGPMIMASHEYDDGYYEDEEGWEDDNGGGYTGGHRGGDYGGGKGGDDYDGDGDGNRCRNFCVYPVQPPEGGQR